MKLRDNSFLIIAVAINIVASYGAFVVAPVEIHMGDLYRIFYIHVVIAWGSYLTLAVSLFASILFLVKKRFAFDILGEVSAIIGLIYTTITIITGAIWANAVWGVYWNWDPRQTTSLVMWLAYLGYVALRLSIDNEEKRASTGAIYNILAFVTVPLSYMSFKIWQSLHPQIVTGSGISITRPMIEILLLNLVASSLIYIFLLKMSFDVKSLRRRIDILFYSKEV